MAKQKTEIEKIILAREYVIPLRKEWLKVPKYKRAKKAIKAIKQFIARHMKVPERDVKQVKINKWLNQEIWFRGIKRPPAKIKVKAIKYEDKVTVELAEIPEKIKYKIEREKKKLTESEKKKEAKKSEGKKKAEEKSGEEKGKEELEKKVEEGGERPAEEAKEEKKKEEAKEKIEAVKEAGMKQAEKQARMKKHETTGKKVQIQRKALKK